MMIVMTIETTTVHTMAIALWNAMVDYHGR